MSLFVIIIFKGNNLTFTYLNRIITYIFQHKTEIMSGIMSQTMPSSFS